MPNYEELEKSICYVIKEQHLKLGYSANNRWLYYPLSSLNHMLGTDCDVAGMEKVLEGFFDYAEERLGKGSVTYKGECVVGVVYAPYLDELYTAVKGEGAWFGKTGEVSDATRLHVSSKESLKECVVASGFPYDKATHPINNIREVSIVIPQVRGFRRMGSAAYDLCCTAMGTIDAYWEFNLNLWDVCAGQLIVREAGGQVIPLCDNRKISIIAGPEKLVKELFLCL